MKSRALAIVLGIRPDVIRASIILGLLQERGCPFTFIWSGQHYSDNLKDVFFRQLKVRPPDIELGVGAESDADLVGQIVASLGPVLERLKPSAAVFLGDTNTVMGAVAAAQLNIPVVHIEGCMRSYDWRMPEEKYRTIVDHISDVIYVYLDEYKAQGVREGLNPDRIIVTGNPIVDVLHKFHRSRHSYFESLASDEFFSARGLERDRYYLMTCHRRENINHADSLRQILTLAGSAPHPVYFPAGYRTVRMIESFTLTVPGNVVVVDPVGYEEFLVLLTHARGVLTDSGTVVEEACILGMPAVQMRRSTERPQVYDAGACVKFDPEDGHEQAERTLEKLEGLRGKAWRHPFGDGRASVRIAEDMIERLEHKRFSSHGPQDSHLDIRRAFRGDGL